MLTSGMRPNPRLQGAPEPIAALNKVKISEARLPWADREPLVDLRAHCPEILLSDHICPYLRRTVANMLNSAQAGLPHGLRLKAGSALRTVSMQKSGWDGYHKRLREEHPEWPLSALRRATNKYFAPYDQKAPPGHCTGGAVDVSLIDSNGQSLDLTSPTKGWQAAYTWSDLLSPEAKVNRMLMVEAMLGAGFSNCRDEYWHYSYGDSAWAVRVGETECPYGLTYPPVALEPSKVDGVSLSVAVNSERDGEGRCLSTEGTLDIDVGSDMNAQAWSLGIYWANGISLSIRIQTAHAEYLPSTLYLGDGENLWESITDIHREGNHCIVRLTPSRDRAVLRPSLPTTVKEPTS